MSTGIGRTKPEHLTLYVDRKTGSDHCFSCEHFNRGESGCDGPKMRELSKRPKLPNGDVKVHALGWCKFYDEGKPKE